MTTLHYTDVQIQRDVSLEPLALKSL